MNNGKCARCHVVLDADTMQHHKAILCRECYANYRRCSVCREVKPLGQFAQWGSYTCRECAPAKTRPGRKTCKTCGVSRPAVDFHRNAKDCPECRGKRRKCAMCGEVLPLDRFYRSASGSGLRRVCCDCVGRLRRDAYHRRERRCHCCNQIKTSFPTRSAICAECFGAVRRCGRCRAVKPIGEFHKDSGAATGVATVCKDCRREVNRDGRLSRTTTCLHCGQQKRRSEFQKDKKVCDECRAKTTLVCGVCGVRQPLSEFCERDSRQALGRALRCRSCARNKSRTYSTTAGGRYRALASAAKKGHYQLDISLEEHAELLRQRCHYCGQSLHPTGSGLDRINPLGGYSLDNVVPCCRDCNGAKSDRFTHDEMIVVGEAIGRVKSARASHDSHHFHKCH